MAWFLALQGPPNKVGQSLMYELHESADRQEIAQEMMTAATIDRVVAIPAVFQKGRNVTLYVRPAAWGAWAFYEMSERSVRPASSPRRPRERAPRDDGRESVDQRNRPGSEAAAGQAAVR